MKSDIQQASSPCCGPTDRKAVSIEIQALWNGYYLLHSHVPVHTETIDGRIHIVTGIGGKGMTPGPGCAQHDVETVLAG